MSKFDGGCWKGNRRGDRILWLTGTANGSVNNTKKSALSLAAASEPRATKTVARAVCRGSERPAGYGSLRVEANRSPRKGVAGEGKLREKDGRLLRPTTPPAMAE